MVSVCIATHNGEKFIKEQIDSILLQLSDNDEIIISDDGSKDKTLKIIESMNDDRIKIHYYHQKDDVRNILRHQSFYFASRNFENAIRLAKGDYIFLCDQDDIWYPNKVNKCIEILQNAIYVKHNFSVIDCEGIILEPKHYILANEEHKSFFRSLKYLPFRGCCTAFRKELLPYILPFPIKCLQHDSWIGLNVVLSSFKYSFIDEPLIYHRNHESNVSKIDGDNNLLFKIKYRLILLLQLINKRLILIFK